MIDRKQCPPVIWHILEVIVNGMMVVEVTTRWIAYGKVSMSDRFIELPGTSLTPGLTLSTSSSSADLLHTSPPSPSFTESPQALLLSVPPLAEVYRKAPSAKPDTTLFKPLCSPFHSATAYRVTILDCRPLD